MKKVQLIQNDPERGRLSAIGWILCLAMMTACQSKGQEQQVDCMQLMDQILEEDAVTGEIWLSRKDKAALRRCGVADSLDLFWLSAIWLPSNTEQPWTDAQDAQQTGIFAHDTITFRMMVDAVEEFRASPDYLFTRSMLIKRERINKEYYSEETWIDAEQYYLDLNWSPTQVDSFRVFLEDPQNKGLTYKRAVNAFLWSTGKR